MQRIFHACVITIILANNLSAADLPDPRLDSEYLKFQTIESNSKEKLIKDIEAENKLILAGRLKAEDKLKSIEDLKLERKAFEEKGHIPLSLGLRPASQKYLNEINVAKLALSKLYDKELNRLIASKATDEASKLLKEKQIRLAPTVIAQFDYTWSDNKTELWELLSDGKVNRPLTTWSIERNLLYFRMADPKIQGGAWIDVLQISPDGKKIQGQNQMGHQKSGVRRYPS